MYSIALRLGNICFQDKYITWHVSLESDSTALGIGERIISDLGGDRTLRITADTFERSHIKGFQGTARMDAPGGRDGTSRSSD